MEHKSYNGLTEPEVQQNRLKFGTNENTQVSQKKLWHLIFGIVKEPMFIILVVASIIYFILGESGEGFIMIGALCFVAGISLFQENRSNNAVEALKKLTDAGAKVIRNGATITIPITDIVVNDILVCEDGNIIPADAVLLEAHDFSVNESTLTGESLAVFKSPGAEPVPIYKGTLVVTGACIAQVTAIGSATSLGKIGESLNKIVISKTPLQQQMNKFIQQMVIAGVIAFFIVWGINFYTTGSFLQGLLHGLTLAMSVLPEELPVAFSTFLALGAYHLYKKNVIARSPQTVEALGAATVICTDKTGTLTENKMQLAAIYDFETNKIFDYTNNSFEPSKVLAYAMWSSEVNPFDPMEKSIHDAYGNVNSVDLRKQFKMVHEYPLSGSPPVMTHIYQNDKGETIIACKGGVETVLAQSNLSDGDKKIIMQQTEQFASRGFRVLAVASVDNTISTFPVLQESFIYHVLGLIAFYDPPKKNTASIIDSFYKAGIQVKMITGDYAATALAIAQQIGLKSEVAALTGNEIMEMDDSTLSKAVSKTNLFVRMFPDAKLKVVEALKRNGEVVAMTGDGVNDGPALKAAHIGIAMGKRGTETAKQAASLIITDDDMQHMIEAVALGRRIYENLKKAIRYIISIHIPIILIVTIPLLLFWDFTDFFNPIHVIFLELIMGPTCSIIFENEPAEPDSMLKKPRTIQQNFFSMNELSLSILQGLVITAGCLTPAYFLMHNGYDQTFVRSCIYSILIFSNLLLTLVNRSFLQSIFVTLKYKNKLVFLILIISITILLASLYIQPVQKLFMFVPLKISELLICFGIAAISVLWVELLKMRYRLHIKKGQLNS